MAADRGMVVVSEYVDAVESGKDIDRPGFQALLRELKARTRQWQFILALDTSRIGRRRHIAQAFAHACDKVGIKVLYAKVPEVDPITEVMLHSMLTAMDEVHSLMSREKGLAGMAENVRQGFRAGGRAPTGYKLDTIPTGAVRDGEPVIKRKLALADDHHKIQAYLKGRAAGHGSQAAARAAGVDLSPSTLISIEWNALTYAGHTVWNMRVGKGTGKRQSGRTMRPREEWVIQRDTHPALITDHEAEQLLARLAEKKQVRVRNNSYLLSGLLVTPAGTAWHGNGAYYRAVSRNLPAAELEQLILARIAKDLQASSFIEAIGSQLRQQMESDAGMEDLQAITREIHLNDLKVARLVDLVSETSTPAPLLAKVEAIELASASLHKRAQAIEQQIARTKSLEEITEDDIRRHMAEFSQCLAELDRTRLKDYLRALIEQITLDPDRLTVCLTYRIQPAGGDNLASPRGFEPLLLP